MSHFKIKKLSLHGVRRSETSHDVNNIVAGEIRQTFNLFFSGAFNGGEKRINLPFEKNKHPVNADKNQSGEKFLINISDTGSFASSEFA